jgi:glyoxylase-like metal-dependent hydrolase (beta-lactamase superfamily II)
MTQSLTTVRFLHSGWCSQFARLAGGAAWTWSRFYAVFVFLEHPIHGACLIDTGYSDEFFRATARFPERFYRWTTPVCLEPAPNAWAQLQRVGIDPTSVRQIFVSHLHADHVAGLKCFPNARFVYRPESYERTLQQSRREQVRHGFLQDLLPVDFRERGTPLPESRFVAGTGVWDGFQICDFWNDGSLILVDLPGHADGHFGFVLQSPERQYFYIVDACWHVQALEESVHLPWISRRFQHDPVAYDATQEKLRRWTARTGIELIACHCPRTLNHVS